MSAIGCKPSVGVARFVGLDESGARRPRTQLRVLIADDDQAVRVFVKLLLECDACEVLEATNGRQAVEIALKEKPELLIIDLDMPEIDGYQAITQLRRDASLAMMPIVVHTGEDGPGIEQRVRDLGADDYLIKSFDPELLLSRVSGFSSLTALAVGCAV